MSFIYLIIFLIWPFGALLFSFKNYSIKWTKNIIWLFVIFYGLTFVLSNETMDANSIKEKFNFISNYSFNFIEIVRFFFLDRKSGVDILQPLIFYFTSLFTNNFNILMGVLASIFGYFYSRNICYLLDRSNGKIKIYNYLILWVFVCVIGFWHINAFRFWTSAHMFFFSVLPYIYEKKTNRLWLLPFIPLLHFSFLALLLVLLLFLFVEKRPKLLFYVFLFSFLISSVNTEAVGEVLLRFLPSNFEYKVRAYTSEDYANELAMAQASISSYLRRLMYIVINLFFVVIYFYNKNRLKAQPLLSRLFTFTVLIMTTSNFISLLPDGDRFLKVSSLFSLSFLFFYIQSYKLDSRLKLLLQLSSPLLFLASIGFIRIGLNTINFLTIIGNPIILLFTDYQKALIEFF